jgi:hypothetical protein
MIHARLSGGPCQRGLPSARKAEVTAHMRSEGVNGPYAGVGRQGGGRWAASLGLPLPPPAGTGGAVDEIP